MRKVVNYLGQRFRYHTRFIRALPDFIIIGGMKCGSSALYEYILQHPEVTGSIRKEVHFFDHKFSRGLQWYQQHFPVRLGRGSKLVGEASPSYIFHPAVPERINETLPSVKLIALLRNPVDRAYSHYHHTKRKGFEDLPFDDAISKEAERLDGEQARLLANPSYKSSSYLAHSYVARGIYWQQLERYYKHFDPSQLLVLKSEDLFTAPQATLNRVVVFLGLESFSLQNTVPVNKAEYRREPTSVHFQLAAFYKSHNEKLYRLIGETYDWDRQYA